MEEQTKTDSIGIGAIVLIVVVAVILAVGAGGYYFYTTRSTVQPKNLSGSVHTDERLSPYKGWKTYTLKYEKLTFMYPSSWSINDSTDAVSANIGIDALAVNGPDGFQVDIQADRPIESLNAGGTSTVLGADRLTFLGKTAYMVYTSFSTTENTVCLTYLNASPTNMASQYVSRHDNPKAVALGAPYGNLAIVVGYTGGDPAAISKQQSLASARNDSNYLAAKSIVESMHY